MYCIFTQQIIQQHILI